MHRLAFLLPEDPSSGAGQRAYALAKGLAGHGWQVAGGLIPRGFRVAQANGEAAALAFMQEETQRLITQWTSWRPDVIHVEVPGPEAMPWRWAAGHLNLPLTSAWHWLDRFVASEKREQVRAHNLEFLNSCRRVHVRTPAQIALLSEIPPARIDVVPNGVDTERFNPSQRDLQRRHAWGASPEDVVCLHVGRLIPEKGLDLLAKTWNHLQHVTPTTRCIVVGEGDGQAALATACPRAQFLGKRQGDELARIYASADVFLFPSRSDSWGLVLTEAMASGLACVAFPSGAAEHLLSDNTNGCLAATDEEFINATTALVRNRSRITRLGSAARHTALRHDWNLAAGAMSESLHHACQLPFNKNW